MKTRIVHPRIRMRVCRFRSPIIQASQDPVVTGLPNSDWVPSQSPSPWREKNHNQETEDPKERTISPHPFIVILVISLGSWAASWTGSCIRSSRGQPSQWEAKYGRRCREWGFHLKTVSAKSTICDITVWWLPHRNISYHGSLVPHTGCLVEEVILINHPVSGQVPRRCCRTVRLPVHTCPHLELGDNSCRESTRQLWRKKCIGALGLCQGGKLRGKIQSGN